LRDDIEVCVAVDNTVAVADRDRGSSKSVGLFASRIVEVTLPADPFEPEQALTSQRRADQTLVVRPNLRITSAASSSSMSMLMRDMYQRYASAHT
jgi:hypothetical protein